MSTTALGDLVKVRVSDLLPYPKNARRGDVDSIAESLTENGQFQPVIVQRSTGYILVGNHTVKAAQKLRWAEIDVSYVDVDDERARKIVLAANRTADRATYDLDALADLLSDVDDLTGTGYSQEDVTSLLAPEPELDEDADDAPQEEKTSTRWGVVVYCTSEQEALTLLEIMLEEGREARAL